MNISDGNVTSPHSSFNDAVEDRYFSNILAIIQGSIYIPIFCAGIANNVLTVLIILINRDMHTVTNCYLLNLAISDSLPLIVSLPFEITFLPIQLPWGQLGCKLRSLLAETSTNASILTISAFTIERYLAVCHPLQISSFSTTRRAIKIQVLIWFIAILSSTPYFHITTQIEHHCQFDADFEFFVVVCFYISATIFFVLPVFILCILYALMARRLYSVDLFHEIRWSKSSGTESGSSPVGFQRMEHDHLKPYRNASTPSLMTRQPSISRCQRTSTAGLALNIHSMKKSAFKMLFAVVIAFIICYAPFHAQRLITSSSNALHLSLTQRRAVTIFYFISGILYYLGSTINPIFYHLFSRKYREAFKRTMKRIVHCQRRRRFSYPHSYPPNSNHSPKLGKSSPIARPVLYPPIPRTSLNVVKEQITPKTFVKNYQSTARFQTKLDLLNNKHHLLRLSLPDFHNQRLR